MRASPEVHVEWVDDEAVVLDPESGELHYLSPTAALFYALVQEHGYDDALAQLRERFGAEPTFEEDLKVLQEEMLERGLLTDG